MKDALGHGSNPRGAHSAGIDAVTKTVQIKPGVLEYIRQNPGGFSITPRGTVPSSGYMVSAPGRTRIVSEADLASPRGQDIINSYAREHSDVLRQPGAHLGGWTDKDTGKTHLDVSHNIGNRNRAIKAGIGRNQIAIWDVKKMREISTGGTGG